MQRADGGRPTDAMDVTLSYHSQPQPAICRLQLTLLTPCSRVLNVYQNSYVDSYMLKKTLRATDAIADHCIEKLSVLNQSRQRLNGARYRPMMRMYGSPDFDWYHFWAADANA